MPVPQAALGQAEWVPDRAICAINLHVRIVGLLLEKLDLPAAQLQELRLVCRRGCKVRAALSEAEVWQTSPVGLFRLVELHCPLWSRLWTSSLARGNPEEETPRTATTVCLSRHQRELLDEVEIQSSAALRHLAHASSHLHEVGEQFSVDLTRRAGSEEETVGEDVSKSPQASPTGSVLATRFRTCLDSYGQVLWTFFLHVQLLHAIFECDTMLVAAWALRLLGLPGPWSLRRLHDFVLCALELLMESPAASAQESPEESSESRELFLEACETYLAVPVIPRMQSRMQSCVTSLRRSGLLPEVRLQEVLSQVESGSASNFDASGAGLDARRDRDAIHCAFQRSLRESVIGRVDRLCPLDVRENLLSTFRELAKPPLVRPSRPNWPQGAQCRLLLEVLASVPQEGSRRSRHAYPRRFLELLEEETPAEEAARMEDALQPPVFGAPEGLPSFPFCSSVCSGKSME